MKLLESYIKNVLVERNFKKHFKKPFDYDLVIFDHMSNSNKASPHNIYSFFIDSKSLRNEILDIKVNKSKKLDGTQIDKDKDSEKEIIDSLKESKHLILELKQNKKVIEALKKEFGFNFSNCNLKDVKPILCINTTIGNDNNIYDDEKVSNRSKQADLQKIKDEDFAWLLHDIHHQNVEIESSSKKDIDYSKIFSDYKPGEENSTKYNKFLSAMYEYFKKINYTAVVHDDGFIEGLQNHRIDDVASSVFGYCLSKMKSANDARKIDFTEFDNHYPDVFVKAGKTIKINKEESREIQEILSNCYKTVHQKSSLSRKSQSMIDKIKRRFEKSKANKDIVRKLKDGSIYIYYINN